MRKKRERRGVEAESAGIAEAIEGGAMASESETDPESEAETVVDPEPDPAAVTEPSTEPGSEPEEMSADDDEPDPGLIGERLELVLESMLFAAEKPLSPADLLHLIGMKEIGPIEEALAALGERYRDRGIVLHCVAGGFQLRTNPGNSEYVQRLIAGRPVRLSRAQLETLAIIAYRQPITRPEIDEIRGVDSGSTLKLLMERDLIRVLGKREEVGRPLIYGTSREFLEFFNLQDLRELPTLREFHELSEDSLAEVAKLDEGEGTGSQDGDRTAEPGEAFVADQTADRPVEAADGEPAAADASDDGTAASDELGDREDVAQ